jgi:hypothetical protein
MCEKFQLKIAKITGLLKEFSVSLHNCLVHVKLLSMFLYKISTFIACGIMLLPFGRGLVLDAPEIDSPEPGDIVKGVVMVRGSTDVSGFQSAETLFGYNSDTTDTWFLIEKSMSPVSNGNLAIWDTTIITDGVYRILVRVYLEDGTTSDTIVKGITVNNYTVIETSTPVSTSIAKGVGETPVAEADFPNTESGNSPEDPDTESVKGLVPSFFRGVGYALLALIVIGALLFLRASVRRG